MSLLGDIGDPKAMDASARDRLARSLEHIAERAGSHLTISPVRLAETLSKLRNGPQYPGVFARYYDLVSTVTSGEFDTANALLDEIADLVDASPISFEIVPCTPERLGSDFERFPRLVFGEFSTGNPMAAPSDEQAAAAEQNIKEGLDIVEQVDPKIRGEIDALFHNIFTAARNPDPEVRGFGGVTSLLAWGGTFMNLEYYNSSLAAAGYLVHEVTHGVLFGLSFDEPLVWNDPSDNFHSPLRREPRPMDGIYHATVVCGRMAYFEQARLQSGVGGEAGSEGSLDGNLRRFSDGVTVIEEHGELSGLGRELLETCKEGLARMQ